MVTISPEVNEIVEFVADGITSFTPDEWGKTPVTGVELTRNGFCIVMESGTRIDIDSQIGIFYNVRVPGLRMNIGGQLDVFQRDRIQKLFDLIVDQLLLE